jgi:hypothetical protein
MSWFPYDSMRKVVCIAGRWYTQWAGGDLVHITQLPHQIQKKTIHIAQDVRLRSQQPSQHPTHSRYPTYSTCSIDNIIHSFSYAHFGYVHHMNNIYNIYNIVMMPKAAERGIT